MRVSLRSSAAQEGCGAGGAVAVLLGPELLASSTARAALAHAEDRLTVGESGHGRLGSSLLTLPLPRTNVQLFKRTLRAPDAGNFAFRC